MHRDMVPCPPVGYRPSIPTRVKLDVVIRQGGVCGSCGEKLGQLAATQFDHDPALQLRGWDDELQDTIPPANDPAAIIAKHKDCHAQKTTGRKGESLKGDRRGGDVNSIARLRRLTRKELQFRERMLRKTEAEPSEDEPVKSRWPKRAFPKRPKACAETTGLSRKKRTS